MKQINLILSSVVLLLIITFNVNFVLSDPALNQSNTTAQGGNITLLSMDGNQQSSLWQGFFGTISGGLVLGNTQGQTMYDWSMVNARGEVLASRFIISDWSTVNCSTQKEIYDEEYRLNIPNSSSEGINDTFKNTTHPTIEIGLTSISGCRSTLTDNTTAQKAVFWNVVLNTDENTTIYTAIIDDNQVGFNGTIVDYQLMVPTNRTDKLAVYNIYLDLT